MIQDALTKEALELFKKHEAQMCESVFAPAVNPVTEASKLADDLRAKHDRDAEAKEREAWERARKVRA
jgi:hypothetical protein